MHTEKIVKDFIKRALITTVALALFCICMCMTTYAEESDYEFYYQIHEGKAYVVGIRTGTGAVLEIPAYVEDYPVVGIGDPYDDFYSCYGLNYEGNLGENGTEPTDYTTTMVKKVILPGTIRYLCTRFLGSNEGVEELVISDGANFAVDDVSIFPDSDKSTIKKIYVGSGMTRPNIEKMFYGKALEEIVVSEKNPVYASKDGILYTKDMKKLIVCGTSNPREVIRVPEGVEIIGVGFQCCNRIKEIYLPSTIKTIGDSAFLKCTAKVYGLKTEDRSVGKVEMFSVSSATTNSINLKWLKVANADGYIIMREPLGEYEKTDAMFYPEKYYVQLEGSKTSYTWKNLSPGTEYTFVIYAFRKFEDGEVIEGEAKNLSAETSLKLTRVSLKFTKRLSAKKAKITWKKVKNAEGYEIYISTKKNGKYKKAVTVKSGKTSTKTIKTLKKNRKYYVKVRAYRTVNKQKVKGAFSKTMEIDQK